MSRHQRACRRLWALGIVVLLWLCASSALAAPPTDIPEGLQPPVPLESVRFEYPPELLEREIPPQGRIVVEYVVATDGTTKEIRVVESPDPALDALAIDVAARLRYEPATYAGEAVEVVLSLAFDVVAPSTPDPSEFDDTTSERGEAAKLDEPVRIRGRLREAGSRTPIEAGTVLAVPGGDLRVGRIKGTSYAEPSEPAWQVRAESDADGHFELRGVPAGRVRLIVLTPGYERTEQIVELRSGRELELTLWPKRLPSNPYQTVVTSDRDAIPEVVERTLVVEEIRRLPGSQGDALKAVLNFPGVARAAFGSGTLAIRGAAPEDSAIYFGYHEIPLLFHFGGVRSVFAAEILTQIDFVPGNFDSRYGDAIGGIVDVQPRKGRRDGYHGFLDTNLFDAGAMVEGPLAKGSFIVAARRSYIDLLLPRVLPDDAGLSFTVAPRYWDYQALFDHPVGGGELSIRAFGSDDRTKLVFAPANDESTDEVQDSVETTQWFHRADVVYRKQDGPWTMLVTPAYRRGRTSLAILDVLDLDVTTDDITGRAELGHRASRRLLWRVGTEMTLTRFSIDVSAPPFDQGVSDLGSSERLIRRVQATLLRAALYTTASIGIGSRFQLSPGLRFEWFDAPLDRAALDPRLRMTLRLGPTSTLKAALGQYTQGIQQPVQFDSTFGNPRLGLQRSLHSSLGFAQQLPWDIGLELTGFHKYLWDLVAPSSLLTTSAGEPRPENFANTGIGQVYGLEFLLRKSLARNIFAWVSYTLSRSERVDAPGEPKRLVDFDQTHILTVLASAKLPRGWQIGGRFRLVSGNPSTAITDGIYDAGTDTYLPIEGVRNGERLPAFHQLDLRVDKTWTWPWLSLALYLDVQNVYNRRNVEFLSFGYDYRATMAVNSLPILPALGIRLEF